MSGFGSRSHLGLRGKLGQNSALAMAGAARQHCSQQLRAVVLLGRALLR